MAAGPIGSVWGTGTWSDTAWVANTWADANPIPPTPTLIILLGTVTLLVTTPVAQPVTTTPSTQLPIPSVPARLVDTTPIAVQATPHNYG